MAELFTETEESGCYLEIHTSQELEALTLGILALNSALEAGTKLIIPKDEGDIKVKENRKIVRKIAKKTKNAFQGQIFETLIVSPDIAPALPGPNSRISLDIPQSEFVYFRIGLGLHQRQELIQMVDDCILLKQPVNEAEYDRHHRLGEGYLAVIRELISLIDPLKGSFGYSGHNTTSMILVLENHFGNY